MKLTLPAPAKINLHLKVTAIRADGLHELDTAFAYVDAADRLDFREADDIRVTCSEAELAGERNLVHRVLTALRQAHGVSGGMHVHIDKRLPAQAGLGGGSSDAATAMIAVNRLWGLGMDADAMIEFAAPFGADIPCFLYGRASEAAGIGERLTDYPEALPEGTVLLAWPGVGLSTAAVFGHFDARHALTPTGGADTMRRVSARLGENDLEASACALSPEVERLLQRLRTASARAWMTGSGSACVALFDEPATATAMADRLQAESVATWTHTGKLMAVHPAAGLPGTDWGVAKR